MPHTEKKAFLCKRLKRKLWKKELITIDIRDSSCHDKNEKTLVQLLICETILLQELLRLNLKLILKYEQGQRNRGRGEDVITLAILYIL